MLEHFNINYNKESTHTPDPSTDQNQLECFHLPSFVWKILYAELSSILREGLGEGYNGDVAFASALEAFGGCHNDPLSVAFGGKPFGFFSSNQNLQLKFIFILKNHNFEKSNGIFIHLMRLSMIPGC